MKILARENGIITPLLAVMLPSLVAASMLGVNAAGIHAAHVEVRRAADLSALAGAASIPLIGALASTEPHSTACDQAARMLAPDAARIAHHLALSEPSCADGVDVEMLAEWETIETVRAALAELRQQATGPSPSLCAFDVLNPGAILDPWLASLTDVDCDRLERALDELPASLSPALVTPRVRVRMHGEYEAPLPLPVFSGARPVVAEAFARRRFKNLVVLPAVRSDAVTGVVREVDDGIDGVPAPLDRFDPNPSAARMRDVLLPALRRVNAELGAALGPFLPPGVTFDASGVLQDVEDLYDPPSDAPAPSAYDVAVEAARTRDPVVILRIFRYPVLGIPAFDFTAAYLTPLADGSFEATPIPVASLSEAHGIFGATLLGGDP